MKRRLLYFAFAFLIATAAAQFIRPNTVNPPVNPARSLWNDRRVDDHVARILRRACADCHSHETEWPWYSKVSPVSWLVSRHVVKGRAKLNLSDWGGPSADQSQEIVDSILKKKMPLAGYVLIHPQARLTQADRESLIRWADSQPREVSR